VEKGCRSGTAGERGGGEGQGHVRCEKEAVGAEDLSVWVCRYNASYAKEDFNFVPLIDDSFWAVGLLKVRL
jgi:hypothetical protein